MITLSERVKKVGPSPTLAITAKAKKMKKEGIDVVGFGAGEPDFDTPQHIKDSAIDSINKGFTKYTPTTGIPELKEAITEKFKRDNRIEYLPEEIIVSCGAKHVLYNVLQVICNEGDNVIILSPYWVSYPEMVRLANAELVFVETKEEKDFIPDPEDIESAITPKTRAVIINSPNNPAGSVYPDEVLRAITEIAVKKDIFLISDEVYEKIIYDGLKHFSPAGIIPEAKAKTITVNAVSKTYSMTGWRIGYAGGPKDIISAMGRLQDHSTSNPASISQMAALAALRGPQDSLDKMVEEYARRRDFAVKKLREIDGVTFSVPKGAFYVMVNISKFLGKKYKSAEELAGALLDEASVAVVPCGGFGAPGYLRLSFPISEKEIEKGLDRIKEWLKPVK